MQYTKFFVFAQKIEDDSATIPYYCNLILLGLFYSSISPVIGFCSCFSVDSSLSFLIAPRIESFGLVSFFKCLFFLLTILHWFPRLQHLCRYHPDIGMFLANKFPWQLFLQIYPSLVALQLLMKVFRYWIFVAPRRTQRAWCEGTYPQVSRARWQIRCREEL